MIDQAIELTERVKILISEVGSKLDVAAEIRKIYGKTLAPDFNSFNFWHQDENKVSEILAFFLNPEGKHGQGDVFLKIFLEELHEWRSKDNLPKIQKLSTKCKLTTNKTTFNNRYIDIDLTFENPLFVLGIENKIYDSTTDQDNQVEHYLEDLAKRDRETERERCQEGEGPGHLLIYLAPKGKEPGAHSISPETRKKHEQNGTLQILNYQEHFIPLIHRFSISCESDRVRYFLKDFESKLKQKYLNESYMEENQLIIGFIKEDEKRLELSLKIQKSVEELKQNLNKKVWRLFKEAEDIISKKYKYTSFHKFEFSYAPDRATDNFDIGLKANPDYLKQLRDKTETLPNWLTTLRDVLNKKDNTWSDGTEWPLYKSCYLDIEINPQYWMDIESGELKNKFIEVADVIYEAYAKSMIL